MIRILAWSINYWNQGGIAGTLNGLIGANSGIRVHLQCIEPRHLTEICRDLANHPQVDHGTLKPSCGWENPDLTSGYLTKDKRLPVLEISDSFFSNTLHHQHIRFKFFFHFSSIFFTAFFSIIKMKSVLSLVAFAAAALAQNVAIGLPTAGQKVTAGDDLIVQIQRPVC